MEEQPRKKFNPIILIIVGIVIFIVAVLIIAGGLIGGLVLFRHVKSTPKTNTVTVNKYQDYQLTGNSIEAFDIYFLQLENEKKNKVYSPLSIKYALEMLSEGADGNTKTQINNILGNYNNRTYPNSSHMSFANAMYIKDTYKKQIKDAYIKQLSTRYNANVLYDSFKSPNAINSWVSEKTFGLIDNLFDDVSDLDFMLINALAIDMEWNKKIQSEDEEYHVVPSHEDYSLYVGPLSSTDYHNLKFKDVNYDVKSVQIAAVANKYDIVNTLGEDKIRETVKKEYDKYQEGIKNGEIFCDDEVTDIDAYLDEYIKDLKSNNNKVSSSTDFSFYTDDKIKVFAKDLKTYDNTTLEYIAIMPTNDSLDNYIKNLKKDDLNTIVSSIKPISLSSFKDGVITEIKGYIPMFNFEYELSLKKDLKTLGITDVFEPNKANLSKMTSDKAYIDKAIHKANIEFSNEGIKAAAATVMGGYGAAECGFDYLFPVTVEKIDLTFDKPYMFMIIDKSTSEVWFTGTVYQPVKYVASEY